MKEISVVIPTFDRPAMLAETLYLLGKQSVAPDEVVLVDNGTTPAILAEDAARPFPLRCFRISARAGAAQARNFGAAVANGRYVAFLDDDDFWDPDYVERLKRHIAMGANGGPAMIVARVDHLENGARHLFRFAGDARQFEQCFYFNPGYLGSSITVERATFLELGGFDVSFDTGEDKELAIRYMSNDRSIVYDADLVAVNRVHERTLSGRIDHVKTARLLLQKYRADINAKIRVKTLREAYKKSGRKRYLVHIFVLKLVLALLSLRPIQAK
jgi:glycosyltransferase involved in cell wall biosynthesis